MGGANVSNKKRLLYVLGIIVGLFVLIIVRLFSLQIVQTDELQQKALNQWTRDTALTAARGAILDSNGVVLAQSGTAYKVLIWPKSIDADERARVATELAKLLDMDYAYVLSKVNDTTKSEIVLKRQVEREDIDQLSALKLGKGVGTAIDSKRYYPGNNLFSQLLGFISIDGAGQAGLEQKYDKYLAGEDGRMVSETDASGRPLAYGVQEMIEPTDGYNIVLTTDSIVQSALEKACALALDVNKAKGVQGIIMNCNTGEIIAMTNQPDYDPNSPPRDDIEVLASLSRNRIVADSYEPGSTFKIITLAAAIDSNTVDVESTSYSCRGYHLVNSERIRCWKSVGHGQQTLTKAVQNSCNPAFMSMALDMGAETFYEYIYNFGFGSTTGSGITAESSGIVTHQKYMTANTLARIGFGQSIAVTPIQLASATCAAVNGGKLMQPYVVDRIVAPDGTIIEQNEPTVVRQVISAASSAKVRAILESVVSEGSGKNGGIPGYRVGGKTGTAQKYEDGKIADGKLVASFIGFAPADDPEYVCLILVDEPQVGVIFGSTVAAPFVRQALEETLRHAGYLPEENSETVTVPDVQGMAIDTAVYTLSQLGLENVYQDTEMDIVTAQVPAAGSIVHKGSEVLLYTDNTSVIYSDDNGEAEMIEVPDVFGYARLDASDRLKAKGFIIKIDPPDQTGTAIRQSPEAGTLAPEGSEVLVEFSNATIDLGD